jgi:hypothetical protein
VLPKSRSEVQLSRPRTFDLPRDLSLSGHRLSVAVRIELIRDWKMQSRAWTVDDSGPWVLTSPRLAPRGAGISAIEKQKILRLGDLVVSFPNILLAAIVFLIWCNARGERELLWLAAYLLATAGARYSRSLEITPDSTPLAFLEVMHRVDQQLRTVALALFCDSVFRRKWLPWTVVGLWLLVDLGATEPLSQAERLILLAIILMNAAAVLNVPFEKSSRGRWSKGARNAIAAGVVVAAAGQLNSFQATADWPVFYLFGTNVDAIFPPILAALFTAMVVRRLLRDRDEKVSTTCTAISNSTSTARTCAFFMAKQSRPRFRQSL